ncbi:nucleotidyl transferase AbiEii/AbiGii toxin family protein [Bradyrhizobium sp. CCBAU 51627]|uniref:nucleotidyl transferase AbiEii/AbiGii toxin family protein n=1 Tax=Bradyrhizobium sp. CCBAU 51627 TaxID=1325088 RepID=UPI003FA486A8
MPDNYLTLSREERLEALGAAATLSGRRVHLLEKDIWVVWAIDGLFKSEFGEHLVFKGGTSLSKGYDVIERFSEDIDVTYDIRQIIPEKAGEDPIPKTNSQAGINEKLATWVKEKALAVIEKHIKDTGVDATAILDGAVHVYCLKPDAQRHRSRSVSAPRRAISRTATRATGMTSYGWTMRATPKPPSMTGILPTRSLPTSRSSSVQRTAKAIRLIMRKRSRAD